MSEETHLKTIPDKNLQITIEFAQSTKLDLNNETYTVYNWEKPQFDASFKMRSEERGQIIEKYYSLNLHNLINRISPEEKFYVGDNCMYAPKLFTILTFKSTKRVQKIVIDIGCNKRTSDDETNARKVKDFLDLVYKIVMKKPELKNAPNSDVMYY